MIAEATPAELDACRRMLPGLVGVFQVLALPKFTRAQAVAALRQVAATQERNLIDSGVVEGPSGVASHPFAPSPLRAEQHLLLFPGADPRDGRFVSQQSEALLARRCDGRLGDDWNAGR